MFKVNQKVKLVIPRENDSDAVFEGYLISEINVMSKNVTIKKDGKLFLHIFFWENGISKKRQDSTLDCKVVPHEQEVAGEVLKDASKEISRQYEIYITRRQNESKRRKNERDLKEKEKADIKAKLDSN